MLDSKADSHHMFVSMSMCGTPVSNADSFGAANVDPAFCNFGLHTAFKVKANPTPAQEPAEGRDDRECCTSPVY
jgi:hypothetical protein